MCVRSAPRETAEVVLTRIQTLREHGGTATTFQLGHKMYHSLTGH